MNMRGRTSTNSGPPRLICRCAGLILGTLLLPLLGVSPLFADATVTTLGGGRLSPAGSDAGFTDGDILQSSQFRNPFGCAVDLAGRVYVADRDNGVLRRLDLAANRCRTVLGGLNQPVAVAVDPTNTVYILTQGDGSIRTLQRGIVSVLTSRLSAPTAMADDGNGSLFVTQNDGTVVRVSISNGSVSAPLLAGLQQPGGIVALDSGLLAVSETGGNRVRIWNPGNGQMVQQIGVGLSGFADGPATLALFDRPCHLAKAPGGSVIVADRGNQRVRLVEADGFVSTIYGVDPLS
jgi:streptogramin lyase